MKPERVQKLISNYGSFSRREADLLVKEGKVKVNGEVIVAGTRATVNDVIEINGKRVKFNLKHEYYLLNKPRGYLCARHDKFGKEVISLIDNYKERNLFTVGRLDVNTTGLLIVTTDGDLSNIVNKPNNEIKKTYLAWINKPINSDIVKGLKMGTDIDGYTTKPIKNLKLIHNDEGKVLVKLTLTEGKKNQIKRMFEAHDRKVINLKRTQIQHHKIDGIEVGSYKRLSKTEMYNGLGISIDA